ncbi:Uncharacterised protein [Acetobacterium wieringae]|nr:Uncharacterised protein [Acetobacterium wieringae]
MIDFFISIFVTVITNIYIIQPYWDQLRDYYLSTGHTFDEISTWYYLLCGASYLLVGFTIYFVIALVKFLANKYPK